MGILTKGFLQDILCIATRASLQTHNSMSHFIKSGTWIYEGIENMHCFQRILTWKLFHWNIWLIVHSKRSFAAVTYPALNDIRIKIINSRTCLIYFINYTSLFYSLLKGIKSVNFYFRSKSKKRAVNLWTYPIITGGPLGTVTGGELVILTIFLGLLVWSIYFYIVNGLHGVNQSEVPPGIKL